MKLTGFKLFAVVAFCIVSPLFLNGGEIFSSKPDCQVELSKAFSICLGDINNDGRNDLIADFFAGDKKYKVAVFYNKNGKFTNAPDMELKMNSKGPAKLAIGDFDNDGKNDIAVNEYKTLHLFLGTDDFRNDISNTNMNCSSSSVYPVKLVNGGKCDFISSGLCRKWMGADKWQYGCVYPPEKSAHNTLCIPCDLNNDKKTDIISLSREANHIRLYYGPFANIDIKPMDAAKFQVLCFEKPSYISTGFLNTDDNPDIAVSNSEKTGIFYQAKPINFSESIPSLIIDCGGPLLIADFNGDKKDDLAVLDSKKRKIFIFLQKDNKFFPEKSEEADCVIPIEKEACFCSGEINGDSLNDLVVSDGVSCLNVYLNKNKQR